MLFEVRIGKWNILRNISCNDIIIQCAEVSFYKAAPEIDPSHRQRVTIMSVFNPSEKMTVIIPYRCFLPYAYQTLKAWNSLSQYVWAFIAKEVVCFYQELYKY